MRLLLSGPVLLLGVVILGYCQGCQGQDVVANEDVAISGSLLKVSSEAYKDFTESISPREGSDFERFTSKIANYDVQLSTTGKHYVVTFVLRPYEGSVPKGGRAEYVYDKKTLKVVEVRRFK